MLDRDPAADAAVGSIECSGTRQSSNRAQGHAVSGTDRMQRAIWIDLPAAAPDDNLPVDNQRNQRAERKSGSWGGDDVAVRPSRHQAILHLAGRRQIVSQPQSERQDRNRNRQPGDRSTPVSALFGIGHLSVSPGNG